MFSKLDNINFVQKLMLYHKKNIKYVEIHINFHKKKSMLSVNNNVDFLENRRCFLLTTSVFLKKLMLFLVYFFYILYFFVITPINL